MCSKKMERERLAKLKQKAEKEKAEKEKQSSDKVWMDFPFILYSRIQKVCGFIKSNGFSVNSSMLVDWFSYCT